VALYLADRAIEGQDTAAAAAQLSAHVLPRWGEHPIGALTAHALRAWRDELATSAPRVRRPRATTSDRRPAAESCDGKPRRRRRSTVNRITTTFKAALNHSARLYPERFPNVAAWREGLRALRGGEAPRERWLEPGDIRALLAACEPDFRDLVRAALYTGCRYGELCRAQAGDYHAASKTLRIPLAKSGRSRAVFLHDEAAKFFAALTAQGDSSEPLLTRVDPVLARLRGALAAVPAWSLATVERAVDQAAAARALQRGTVVDRLRRALGVSIAAFVGLGRAAALTRLEQSARSPWGKSHQARRIKDACRRARIEPISFHGLRHTYASLAVQAGMALLAVARNLGHADTRMVERHYGHLSDQYMREQVRRYAPILGRSAGDGEHRHEHEAMSSPPRRARGGSGPRF